MAVTALLAAVLPSCEDDIHYNRGIHTGSPVTVTLNFRMTTPADVTVSRSAANDQENALANLQVFVFGEDGTLQGYLWKSSGLNQTGDIGTVTMTTNAGSCYIYGIANVNGGEYTIGDGVIPKTVEESQGSMWSVEAVTAGYNPLTLEQFKDLEVTRACGLSISGTFLMSGVMNGGALVQIGEDGSVTADDDIIKLHRVVSKVTVDVTTAADTTDDEGNTVSVSFKPLSLQVVNIPTRVKLIEQSGVDADVDDNSFDTFDSEFYDNTPTVDAIKTYRWSGYYLPENLQEQKVKITLDTWEERELDNGGDDVEPRFFEYAPENATYIVISGVFYKSVAGAIVTQAEVDYYIHLGDFGEDKTPKWNDFNIERNCNYTYTITVNDVTSVRAEVEKETIDQSNGSSEGLVLSLLSGSEIFEMDSHYGQLNLSFDQTCVIHEDDEYYVYLMSEDVRHSSGVIKVSKSVAGAALMIEQEVAETGDDATDWHVLTDDEKSTLATSLDWLEFTAGIDDGDGGTTGVPYPGKGDASLCSLFDVLDELIEAKIAGVAAVLAATATEESWTKEYTCYINENYYDDMEWEDFVNVPSRYAYLCRELKTSYDLRTISGAVIYGITQKSIQTFYNNGAAFGVECNYEDNYGCRSANADGTAISYASISQVDGSANATSAWDGYANSVAQLKYGGYYADDGGTGWTGMASSEYAAYTELRYSFMSRNRDLDGDGVIDGDEIRWYAPTIQQYAAIFIGQFALDGDARLFNGNTALLEETNWLNRKAPAIHYWSSTPPSVTSAYQYWAEEGIATSSTSYDNAPKGVRCVRNLSTGKMADATDKAAFLASTPQVLYSFDTSTRLITLSDDFSEECLRITSLNTELPAHTERGTGSYNVKPYKTFYVARSLSEATTAQQVCEDATTVCGDYSEDGDGGRVWRAPSLMELGLMYLVVPSLESENNGNSILCRTKYSNSDFRYSWIIDTSDQVVMIENSEKTNTKYVRCVRDAY